MVLAAIEKSQLTADIKVLTAEYNSAQRALEEVGPNIRRFEVKNQTEKEEQEMLDANTEAIESRPLP